MQLLKNEKTVCNISRKNKLKEHLIPSKTFETSHVSFHKCLFGGSSVVSMEVLFLSSQGQTRDKEIM